MEATEQDESVRCENADCKVAEDGKCIEGIPDLANCSHFGKSVVLVQRSRLAAAPAEPVGVRLSSAEALSMAEAQSVIRNCASNVIGIVGPQDAGKTSLIACIFDLFQSRTVGDFAFAGSSTLYAFERACHETRRESGNKHADMERTPKGIATFLHLDLANCISLEKRAVLFANRAGEDYTDAQSDPGLGAGFFELQRSDTLTMLVDGERLLDLGARQQVRDDILLTLRALVEGEATQPNQRIAVVMTKVDAINSASEPDRSRATAFFEEIFKDVVDQFSKQFLEIKRFEVAASPKGGDTPRGTGMETLLGYWMERPGRSIPVPVPRVGPLAGRVFGRLTRSQPKASHG